MTETLAIIPARGGSKGIPRKNIRDFAGYPLIEYSIAAAQQAKTVTRIRTSDGRVDTLGLDKPRDGLRYRAPNSCTFGGVAGNCSQTVQLVLQGMGITFSVSVGTVPTNAFLSISVNKPS
jgi:hypothetical protein